MNHQELLDAYNQLKLENIELKEELASLQSKIASKNQTKNPIVQEQDTLDLQDQTSRTLLAEQVSLEAQYQTGASAKEEPSLLKSKYQTKNFLSNGETAFTKYSSPASKIELFLSLFRGRSEVYAKRFIHSQTGKPGYMPVKATFDSQAVNHHLRGNLVVGIFPLTLDHHCYFLAIDLDKNDWQKEAGIIRKVAKEHRIPIHVERSRSGNGAHLWIFFEEAIPARLARKLGTLLITLAMEENYQMDFTSYDRLFPNQDVLPKGGYGNLIALPLQKEARKNGNSVFVDENFLEYEDQWQYLNKIKKVSAEDIEKIITSLDAKTKSQLGLSNENVRKDDFPRVVYIKKINQLYIQKEGISQKGLTALKRMAAFQNAAFYQAQAMRKSTWNIPRIISCSGETDDYLILPRGLQEKVATLLNSLSVPFETEDRSFKGEELDVEFKGELRPEQEEAVEKMLESDTGILCGATAFGKTISALKMIAERKVNTLILVNKTSLAEQWREKIKEFLNYEDKDIGQLGGGKKKLMNKIDVALLQSMYRKGKVHESIYRYGMIIIDECHHISAFSFESILKQANAKYVYGLTATPTRKDGHQPIVFMQCGPIRYQNNSKAMTSPFKHRLITRFIPLDPQLNEDMPLHEIYHKIAVSPIRNEKIFQDVIHCFKEGRNSMILTERVEHVRELARLLKKEITDVLEITGDMSKKERQQKLQQIREANKEKPLTIISTGRYIGEGFDEPRLDTLFLAMPISWKGRVQQYAGRLHRLYQGKREVRIYDYADIHVPVLEKMYQKRLKSYSTMGYQLKVEGVDSGKESVVFSDKNYPMKLKADLEKAKSSIIILSPSVTQEGVERFVRKLLPKMKNNVEIKAVIKSTVQEKLLQKSNINLLLKASQHQHCVLIDSKIIWYGNINVLGNNQNEDLFIRLESLKMAEEMERTLKISGAAESDID